MGNELDNTENEFQMIDLLRVFKRFWIMIVSVTLAVAVIMGIIGSVNKTTKYTGVATFWVNEGKENLNQMSITGATQMATHYMELATKDKFLRRAVQKAALNNKWSCTEDEAVKYLSSIVKSSKSNEDSIMFSIYVTSPSSDVTYDAINSLQYSMIEMVAEINGDDITTGRSDYITLVGEVHSSSDLRVSVDNGFKKTAVSTLVAFVVMYIIAFLIYMNDNKVRDVEMLKKKCTYPVLGAIPDIKTRGKKADTEEQNHKLKVVYDLTAANIIHKIGKGDGKNLVSFTGVESIDIPYIIKIADAVANSGKKILIIDCIPGSKALSKYCQDISEEGIFDFSENGITGFSELPVTTVKENLCFLGAGKNTEDISAIIHSDKFAKLLDEAKETYGGVLLLTAPVSQVSDSAFISQLADSCIITVLKDCSGYKELGNVILTLNELDVNVLGVIFGNKERKN